MAISVRRAAPADVPALVRLWGEMWGVHEARDARMRAGPMAEMVMRRSFEEHLAAERSEVLVAEDGGAVVGYALGMILEHPPVVTEPAGGYVSDLAVTASARGRGTGTRLVDALHAWFRSRGVPYATVNVAVRNAEARAFWRRRGYAEFVEQLRTEL